MFVNLPHSQKVAVIDWTKSAVIATWTTGDAQSNFPIALDKAAGRLFIVCRKSAVLLVLDTKLGAMIAKLPTVGDSDDLFYDQERERLYASCVEGKAVVYQQQDADHYSRIDQRCKPVYSRIEPPLRGGSADGQRMQRLLEFTKRLINRLAFPQEWRTTSIVEASIRYSSIFIIAVVVWLLSFSQGQENSFLVLSQTISLPNVQGGFNQHVRGRRAPAAVCVSAHQQNPGDC